MWKENKIFKEDLEYCINASFLPWNEFDGKTFFVTGVTGLIGYTFACALMYHALVKKSGIKVIALVRDIEKAKVQFKELLADGANLSFVVGSVESLPDVDDNIDYIVHGACPTASAFFTEHPVETIQTIISGTYNILDFARRKNAKGVVHLSSMEVYGETLTKQKLSENDLGKIDLTSPRSSYPEAKRLAENLCACFAKEYNVPVKVARLVQTFGPGVKYDDNRVFAYMLRCALEDKNIELKTSGEKENSYLYTMDAVTAILLLLCKGENGKTYNVANEETYCSVKNMGQIVLDTFGKAGLQVETNVGANTATQMYPPPVHDEPFCKADEGTGLGSANNASANVCKNAAGTGFRPDGYLNLSCEQLEQLGWVAITDLPAAYKKTAETMEK